MYTSEVFYGDPFKEEIVKYLDPKDLYNIRYVSKNFCNIITFKMIKDTIKNNIYQRLRRILGDHTDKFLELLTENSGVISGSFILQCILNETYSESDIDIYIPTPTNRSKSGIYNSLENYIYNGTMKSKFISGDNQYIYESDNISYIREYQYIDLKIQIIYIFSQNNIENLWEPIKNLFDFDIVKNIYSENALKIYKLSEIMEKTTTFKKSWDLRSSIARYNKYSSRGFTFKEPTAGYQDLIFNSKEFNFIKVVKLADDKYMYLNAHDEFSKLSWRKTFYISTINKKYMMNCDNRCPLKNQMLKIPDTEHFHCKLFDFNDKCWIFIIVDKEDSKSNILKMIK